MTSQDFQSSSPKIERDLRMAESLVREGDKNRNQARNYCAATVDSEPQSTGYDLESSYSSAQLLARVSMSDAGESVGTQRRVDRSSFSREVAFNLAPNPFLSPHYLCRSHRLWFLSRLFFRLPRLGIFYSSWFSISAGEFYRLV